MKVVCGLGNPGARYVGTRHNVGFMVVEGLVDPRSTLWRERRDSRLARVNLEGEDILVVEPQTYMNLSGKAVSNVVGFYKTPLTDLLTVHDDVDLPLGRVRMQSGGGDGGHKGVRSIIEHLGSGDFDRIRVGIGRPAHPGQDVTDYVLGRFNDDETDDLATAVEKAAAGLREWAVHGLTMAQNLVNRREHIISTPSCPRQDDDPGHKTERRIHGNGETQEV